MDDRMQHRAPWMPWALTSMALLVVAVVAYTLGSHRGLADVGDPGGQAWRHGPFPGIFFLFLLFWVFGGLRWIIWGRYGGPWRYRRYGDGPWHDDRESWEAWHRREHERMDASRPEASSRSGTRPGAV